MTEIKFIGRGGHGVVLASQILAKAFFLKGFYPQCYSLFGGERRGAPVKAFLRVDTQKILLKCEIKKADHLILTAPDLLLEDSLENHVKKNGLILINSPVVLEIPGFSKIKFIDAERIARECGLGAIINTAILGSYAKIIGELPLEYLEAATREYVPSKLEENLRALRRAYEETDAL